MIKTAAQLPTVEIGQDQRGETKYVPDTLTFWFYSLNPGVGEKTAHPTPSHANNGITFTIFNTNEHHDNCSNFCRIQSGKFDSDKSSRAGVRSDAVARA